jgi:hypothetical protein
MINFYGPQPPAPFSQLLIGGICPHCKTASRYTGITVPNHARIIHEGIKKVVVCYACDNCKGAVPIEWNQVGWNGGELALTQPQSVLRTQHSYDFDHVPEPVAKEIKEALDCLSVGAYNGFGGCCRRAIQALSTNLGAGATTKVKKPD